MNQSLYRIVFNQSRGLLMVVAENVTGQGKTSTQSAQAPQTRARLITRISALRFAFLAALGAVTLLMPVQAAVQSDHQAPTSQQPTILKTANGVEQVNIQTPSAGGVSRNTYSQFDVDRGGVILNNSRKDVQTQQGGWVQGNPWLATGSARIILNEVRSSNPSSLKGYVEVAGQRAEVIIANPSGIQCDGCGFINASRATLTTGSAIFSGDSLTGFRVGQGAITISGAGMDASLTDYTSLIARSVQVNAGVWANNLNVTTGTGDVAVTGDSIIPSTQAASGPAPTFAIDVAQLGGMYAGQIHLIGTEAGVGVRNAGQIGASAGEVIVQADGRISNSGLINATTQVQIKGAQGFENSGNLYANQATTVQVTGSLSNSGVIAAGGDVTLQAKGGLGQISNTGTGTLVAGLKADGNLGDSGNLSAQADSQIDAAGLLASGGEQHWSAPQASLANSQLIARTFSLAGDQLDLHDAKANIGTTLDLQAHQSLNTAGAQLSADQLKINTPQLDNRNGQLIQTGNADLTLAVSQQIDNRGGRIATNARNLTLTSTELLNDHGQIEHAGSGTLSIQAVDQHGEQSRMTSTGVMNLSGQTLNYSHSELQANAISLNHSDAVLDGSKLTSRDGLSINTQHTLSTQHAQLNADQMTISAENLNNQGGTWQQSGQGDTQIVVSQVMNNAGGRIASNGQNLTIHAAEINQDQARIEHAGTGSLTIDSANQHGHQAELGSAGEAHFSGQTLQYTNGKIQANQIQFTHTNATLDGSTITSQHGLRADIGQTLSSQQATLNADQMTVNASTFNNQGGQWLQSGQGDTQFNITGQFDHTGGRLATNGQNLTIQAGTLVTDQARIEHAGTGVLRLQANQQSGTQTHLASQGTLQIAGGSLSYTQSDLQANTINLTGQTATLDGSTLTSNGQLNVRVDQTLSTRNVDVHAAQLTVTASSLNNQGGQWKQSGQGDTQFNVATQMNNSQGQLTTNARNVTIHAGELINDQAHITHAGTGTLSLESANQYGDQTQITTAGNLTLTGDTLSYTHGTLQAQQIELTHTNATLDGSSITSQQGLQAHIDQTLTSRLAHLKADQLTVNAGELNNQGGEWLQSGAADTSFTVRTRLDNTDGKIATNGQNLSLNAVEILNHNASIEHAGTGSLLLNAPQLDNHGGEILSQGAVRIDSATIQNGSGTIQGQQLTLQGDTLDNQQGLLLQKGSAATQIQLSGALDNRNGIIASNGNTSLTAGSLDNRGGKWLQQNDSHLQIHLDGSLNNSDAGIIQAQQLHIQSADLSNHQGKIVASDMLDIHTSGALDNHAGTLAAQNQVKLYSGDLNNQAGTIAAVAGDVQLTTQGLNNQQGKLLAATTLTLNSGALDNQQGVINGQQLTLDSTQHQINNAGGTINASGQLSIQSGAFDNTAGQVRAGTDLSLDTHGQTLTNTNSGTDKGIQAGGNLTLSSGDVNNNAGLIYTRQDLSMHSGVLNNGGRILAEQNLQFTGTEVNNLTGQIQAGGNLTLNADRIDNQNSLIRAGGTTTLTATLLNNHNTQAANQGIEGQNITLTTHTLDNRSGDIRADQRLDIVSDGQVLNGQGLVAAGQATAIRDQNLGNKQLNIQNDSGQIQSGHTLALNVASYSGTAGRLASMGDLNFSVLGDYTHQGTFESNGNLSISTTGQFMNPGVIRAGQTLTVQGAGIDNQTTGELSAGSLHLNTTGTLTNRGLLDGGFTWLEVGTLNNVGTGRIYGDYLSIAATTLNNGEENGTAATIAARQQLDLGVGTLNNSEHGYIFSAGDMHIGGQLDANQEAQGQATLISNRSATIESLGNITINAAQVENKDLHLVLGEQISAPTPVEYYLAGGKQYRPDEVSIKPAVPMVYSPADGAPNYLVTPDGEVDQWYQVSATRTTHETKVMSSDAAKIVSGGNLSITAGHLLNDNSQIIAGNTLTMTLSSPIENLAATGTRTIDETGTSTHYWNVATYGAGCHQCGFPGGTYVLNNSPGSTNSSSTTPDISLGTNQVLEHTAGHSSGIAIEQRQINSAIINAAQAGTVHAQGSGSISVESPTLSRATGPQDNAVQQQASGTVSQILAATSQLATAPTQLSNQTQATLQQVQDAKGTILQKVRTLNVAFGLPNNSLFKTNTKPGSHYLVETDPRFAGYKNWRSSDYMLKELQLDPDLIQKRLGDGFYEQKLIREQVAQLTGQRFLGNFTDDDAQYAALQDQGVAFAKAHNLRPGVELTADQMAQLTADMVWLVEQNVTLPDGTVTQALVPKVYTMVREGDINGSGSLIAGRDINIKLDSLFKSNGTLAAKNSLQLVANDIELTGGRVQGNTINLAANQDLKQLGGVIEGLSKVQLSAGRDIVIASNSRTQSSSTTLDQAPVGYGRSVTNVSSTTLGERTGISVAGDGGTLVIRAGRDLTLTAADINNSGAQGTSTLTAGRNLALNTVEETSNTSQIWQKPNNTRSEKTQTLQGSEIHAAGDVTLKAGQDLTVTAATLRSENGDLNLNAGKDLTITAGMARQTSEEAHQTTSKRLLSKQSTTTLHESTQESAVGSTLSAENINLQSGHDLNVMGSTVVGSKDVNIKAGHDLNIASVTESSTEHTFTETKKSGLMSTGGASFTYGKQKQSQDTQISGTEQSHSGSQIGSLNGNVTLTAANGAHISGSEVKTPNGDITVAADHILIDTGTDQQRRTDTQKFEQKGITVAVSAPVISALEATKTAADMVKTAGATKDSRVALLAGTTAGLAAKNAYDGLNTAAKSKDGVTGINVSVSYGETKSTSTTNSNSQTHNGSSLEAGGNLKLIASGSGKNSNINVIGSDLKAGKDLTLAADGDITLQAAQDTHNRNSSNSSSSSSFGVSYGIGKGTAGLSVNASASKSKGSGSGNDINWLNSHASAGETLSITSGGDTNLKGATATGKHIVADIGGNLNIESLQDSSKYDSQQKSIGGSISVGLTSVSGSLNVGRDKTHADYLAVNEQSGLNAGKGGFDIKVKGNTDLKGSVITSEADASKNKLSTGTLTTSDLNNHAEYTASSVGIGVGFGSNFGKEKDGSAGTNPGTVTSGKTAGNGIKANTPVVMAAKGDDSSTTRSGIAAGNITITNEDAQQQLTGKTAAEQLASLNRDTGNTAGHLANNYDQAQIDVAFKVTKEFINQSGTFMANRAAEADAKKKEISLYPEGSQERKDAQAAYDEAAKWSPGGEYGRAMTVLQVAAGGNVTGGMGNLMQSAAVSYIQSLGVEKVKEFADSFEKVPGVKDESSESARTAFHAILACAGAAATGQNCGSGALGAASSVILNNVADQLQHIDGSNLSAEEKEQRKNAIGSMVAGIALMAGGDASAANGAAQIEMENNYLTPKQITSKQDELTKAKTKAERDAIENKYAEKDAQQAQEAGKKLITNQLGVMTPEEFSQIRDSLQLLAQNPSCNTECRSDAERGVKQLNIYLTAYDKHQENLKSQEFVNTVGNVLLALIPMERIAALAKSGPTALAGSLVKQFGADIAGSSVTGAKTAGRIEVANTGVAATEAEVLAKVHGGRSPFTEINGALGEAHGWQRALESGHVPISEPGKASVPGADFITYNPETKSIVVWDAKYRAPGGSYPSSLPAEKLKAWSAEVSAAVKNMPPGADQRAAQRALDSGRVTGQIFKWPQ
ncbi:hemagglutinin repeat-containing protein [Chitinibacter bivalviorum]|uniref:Hemagglutinin repeat-containing protein n=1 Tax=Chitinibacter bivalviorum TaxID=2739434 RepID=A0A7H9BKL1_9NEIS|nr:hemagglutinin repeat-containing protein [Chitinibacter bivalviorum]QLG88024.1 hemagglutinin repeat-containing protein [Chitinibacter bivalviorum]